MLPQRSHITRKRGVYYYRRRLPAPSSGEVAVSLGTRHYREAEHRAGLLHAAFVDATRSMTSPSRIADILRTYLREALDADREHRLRRPSNRAVYALGVDE